MRNDQVTHEEKMELDALERAAKAVPRLYKLKTLVLNADMQPMSYNPLSTEPWTKIMFWLVKGWHREKAGGKPIIRVLETYPDVYVRAAGREVALPSVVCYAEMQPLPKKVSFTRYHVYLRDDFTCQYTGQRLPAKELNFDHVVPQSRGGKTSWENIVTASAEINSLKGDMSLSEFTKTYGYRLIRQPYEPTAYEIREKGRQFPPDHLHESWQDYLYWDTEIDEDS